jgi:hypothetical protein
MTAAATAAGLTVSTACSIVEAAIGTARANGNGAPLYVDGTLAAWRFLREHAPANFRDYAAGLPYGDRLEVERALREAGAGDAPASSKPFELVSAADFVRRMRPPEFVVDGLFQRGYLYAITGATGTGKTSVGINLGGSTALGWLFAGRETVGGNVLYVASENPDDVAGRLAAWCQANRITPADVGDRLRFIDESFVLSDRQHDVIRAIEACEAIMVLVDTDQAVAGSDDENDNAERIRHAKRLRALTRAATRPVVIDLCHPAGAALKAALRPRGGTSFLAEVDGNVGCWSDDDGQSCELFRTPKFRGADFDPITFRLARTTVDAVLDHKGRPLASVVAVQATPDDEARMEHDRRETNLAVLRSISTHPDVSVRERARGTGCSKSTVQRAMAELRELGLIKDGPVGPDVTPKGKQWLAARA